MNTAEVKEEQQSLKFFKSETDSDDGNVTSCAILINEPSTSTDQYDLKCLKEISGDDFDFEKEFIELFLTEIPKEMEILQAAVYSSNIQSIKFSVHKIKSPLKMLGLYLILDKIVNLENIYVADDSILDLELRLIGKELARIF